MMTEFVLSHDVIASPSDTLTSANHSSPGLVAYAGNDSRSSRELTTESSKNHLVSVDNSSSSASEFVCTTVIVESVSGFPGVSEGVPAWGAVFWMVTVLLRISSP